MRLLYYYTEPYSTPIWAHLLAIGILLTVFFIMRYRMTPKPIEPGTIEPLHVDTVISEYYCLYSRIQGAATTVELACIEDQVYEFEEAHKSHCDVKEYFSDLMVMVKDRYNELRNER